MSFINSAISPLTGNFAFAATRSCAAAVGAALTLAVLTAGPVRADAQEAAAQESDQQSSAMSERQMRREARRREREDAVIETGEPKPVLDIEGNPVTGNRPVVLVEVEPEIECHRVQVVGSRLPREVCKPVEQIAAEEAEAQEFLRRTRERSTLTVPCPATNPALPGPAATIC